MPLRTDFESLLDRSFSVNGALGLLTLRRVAALPSSPREGGGFRLEFVGERALSQGTYVFACGDLNCDIFIVPIAQEGPVTIFEAIFN